MNKRTSYKKKAALTLAVLGAISPALASFSMGWNELSGVAEAADETTPAPTRLTNAEITARGLPIIPGWEYYSDGHIEYEWNNGNFTHNRRSRASIVSYDNNSMVIAPTWNAQAQYIAKTTSGASCFAYSSARGSSSGHYSVQGISDAGSCGYLFKSWKNHIVIGQNGVETTWEGSDGGTAQYTGVRENIVISAPGTGVDGVDSDGSTIKFKKDAEFEKNVTIKGTTTHEGAVINKGDVTNEKNVHTKGNETIDGTLRTKGDATFDKNVYVHGSETIDKNLTVHGSETVDGDSHVKGNETVDKDLTVHGSETIDKNLHVKGNEEVDGNTHIHGNQEIDKNQTVHGNQTVDGDSTIHGNQTIDKNLRVHGNEEVDGDSHIHGNSEIDKNQTVHGDQHINGNQDVDKNQTVHGNQTVDGDSRIHGNQVVDKDATVYGNTDLKGDLRVENNARILGDTQLGDDKMKDRVDVWAKTYLHGDTTVGDDANDKLTVNATSEFRADTTFDKNVKVKGDLEVDGNSTIHGNQTVDGDSHVKGSSETDGNALVHGNGTVEGDFEVRGNAKLGDDKTKDIVDINAKANLHGDTTIGDSADDTLTVNATSEFTANAVFDKDVHVKGNLETDGDTRTHGNSITDGNAVVYGNAGVAQNFTVGGNSYVMGNSVVDGDIYGRSFNVGDEKYIDKDGINANNHKIRNIADGEIGPNSLDAVNGRQLWHTQQALQHNVNQVGAQTAAMANLHPMDFEYGDKFSLAAAVGGYQNQQAFALGAFVKPTQKSMFSLTGTLGMSQNMYGVGFTQKFGKKADFEHMTETQLQDELEKLSKDAAEIKEHDKQIKEENMTLRKASRVLAESIDANSLEISRLKAIDEKAERKNEVLTAQNELLQGEVSSLKKQVKELTTKNSSLEKGLSEVNNVYKKLLNKVNKMTMELKQK